ncbi:MAG: ammonia-forming cytochrome c nitrite reductase subunit c552 [Chloroflexi bacterium]|nr:ammonia-forming cytochrome c nitrite reductase subunit c552 [Chloroflexota bacterium]
MNKLWFRVGILISLSVATGLFLIRVPVLARPPAQKPVPHVIEGRETLCLACHTDGVAGAPKFPADHAGRTNEQCLLCHKERAGNATTPGAQATVESTETISGTITATAIATDTVTVGETETAAPAQETPSPTLPATPSPEPTTAPSAPRIPHALQGRDDCLACHSKGEGGAPVLTTSHAGRTSDTCRLCHQPAEPGAGEIPQILPTLIPHPTAIQDQNSCVQCHTNLGGKFAETVQAWSGSIHSQRGVTCADCHGGDPTNREKEAAHSTSANFVGKPKTVDIPALCASCHARVELMRQYDLPTDQWAKYQQSIHGKELAQGNVNVATCFVCHDGHATKESTDPSAQVYPLNIPALCGSCHSNVELMKPYNIPTNQYELYTKSVHGIGLLQKQDLRAPSCATCHGTHGAAPPGFEEVANVCGSCHTATQDYYLKSVHASNTPGTPKCVTCHGRYDVESPSDAMFHGDGARECGSCHTPTSPQNAAVQEISSNIESSARAVDEAAKAIKEAAGSALIVAPEEAKLAEARTSLITARAAQHTLNRDTIKKRTDAATAKAKEVTADAQQAIANSIFRREIMAIGLAIMVLAISALWLVRRELYKELPKK